MYTLALDTTGYKIHLALLKNDTVVFERDWRSNMNEDETISKTLQHLLELEPFFTQKLTKIIVNEGPGTLTGTRVGVAMANALATSTHAPMVKLASHDVWPMRLREEDRQRKPHLLLRITEQELFVDGEIMDIKDVAKMITKEAGRGKKKNQYLAFGELTPTQFSLLNKIKGFLWIIETDLLPFASAAQQVREKGDKKYASPRYAKPPVITESKKKPLVAPIRLDGLPDFVPLKEKAQKLVPTEVEKEKIVKKFATQVEKKKEKVLQKVKPERVAKTVKNAKKSKKAPKKTLPKKSVVKKVAPKKQVKKVVPKKAVSKKSTPKKSVFKALANKLRSFTKKKKPSKK